ncbi:MAG TPA: hypothetical protein VF002_09410 [Gaiellaceae bacterium]
MRVIWNQRRIRLGFTGVATLVTAAALASAGFAGLRALNLGSAAAHQYPGKKVTLCHRTHSKKHPWVKIRVSTHALKAHLRHGDFVVDSAHPCPPVGGAAASGTKHKHGSRHHKGHQEHGRAAGKHGTGAPNEHANQQHVAGKHGAGAPNEHANKQHAAGKHGAGAPNGHANKQHGGGAKHGTGAPNGHAANQHGGGPKHGK